jgi:hypothetical protein
MHHVVVTDMDENRITIWDSFDKRVNAENFFVSFCALVGIEYHDEYYCAGGIGEKYHVELLSDMTYKDIDPMEAINKLALHAVKNELYAVCGDYKDMFVEGTETLTPMAQKRVDEKKLSFLNVLDDDVLRIRHIYQQEQLKSHKNLL